MATVQRMRPCTLRVGYSGRGEGMNGRANIFHKLLLRLLSLAPGVYNLVLVIDDGGVKWSVQEVGRLEG